MSRQATSEVMAMNEINFSGNIIPSTWYQHLRYDSGKPNLNAVVILSDIVYWYRPREIRDEQSGQVIGYKKKFDADKLQRGYTQLSIQFGLTKKQCRDAVTFLEEKGVITKELRTIQTQNGPMANVLFIGIIPSMIRKITTSQVTPMTSKSHPPNIEVTPSVPESQTYTKNTTKNTTKNITPTGEKDDYSDILGKQPTDPPEPQAKNGKSLTDMTESEKAQFLTLGIVPGSTPAAYDTLQEIQRAGWILNDSTVEMGIAHYIEAVRTKRPNFAVPNGKGVRSGWYKEVKDHLQDYKLEDLPKLYKKAVTLHNEKKWRFTRPASLTNTMVDIASEMTPGNSKVVASF